jgi:hypothetical protein
MPLDKIKAEGNTRGPEISLGLLIFKPKMEGFWNINFLK